MSLQPYQTPYCQIFYTGTVSAVGDPAPLVPPDLRSPGITQVSSRLSTLWSVCWQQRLFM